MGISLKDYEKYYTKPANQEVKKDPVEPTKPAAPATQAPAPAAPAPAPAAPAPVKSTIKPSTWDSQWNAMTARTANLNHTGSATPEKTATTPITTPETTASDSYSKATQTMATQNVGRGSEQGSLAKAYISTVGNGDFKAGIKALLEDPNSGLQTRQRAIFREYLDSTDGTKGQFSKWMDEIANGRPMSYNGKQVQVSADDKANIIRAMYNKDTAAIEGILNNAMKRIDVDLDSVLELSKKSENLGTALQVFRKSVTDSVRNFTYSKTEDAVKQSIGVDDAEWFAMDVTQKAKAMTDFARENGYSAFEMLLSGSAEQMSIKLKDKIVEKEALLTQQDTYIDGVITKIADTQKDIQTKFESAVKESNDNILTAFTIDTSREKEFAQIIGSSPTVSQAVVSGTLPADTMNNGIFVASRVNMLAQQLQQLNQYPQTQGFASQVAKDIRDNVIKWDALSTDPQTLQVTATQILKDPELGRRILAVWDKWSATAKNAVAAGDYTGIGSFGENIKTAESTKNQLLQTAENELTEAKNRKAELANQRRLVDKMKVDYEQGVYSPKQILDLALEEAREIEYKALGTVQAAVKSYNLGGYEGRQTFEESMDASRLIERKTAKASTPQQDLGILDSAINQTNFDIKQGMRPEFVSDIKPGAAKTPQGATTPPPLPDFVQLPNGDGLIIDKSDTEPTIGVGSAYAPSRQDVGGMMVDGYSYRGADGQAHFRVDESKLGNLVNQVFNSYNNAGKLATAGYNAVGVGLAKWVAETIGAYAPPTEQQIQVLNQYGVAKTDDLSAKDAHLLISNRAKDLLDRAKLSGVDPNIINNAGNMSPKELASAVQNTEAATINKNIDTLKQLTAQGQITPEQASQLNNTQVLTNPNTFKEQVQRAIQAKKTQETIKEQEATTKAWEGKGDMTQQEQDDIERGRSKQRPASYTPTKVNEDGSVTGGMYA